MSLAPLAELFRNRTLLRVMTLRDFRSKYAGSLMGVFWSFLTPLLLLLVFTFIFTVVFKARFGDRPEISVSALYILCGILPWLAFQEGVTRAATSLLEHKNLVTRARFPLSLIPVHPALSSLMGQAAGFVILMAAGFTLVHPPGLSLLALPFFLALQVLFTAGLCLFLSAIAAYLRDLIHVLPVLLLVWFYGTPVFYPLRMVPDKFRTLLLLNPMTHFISAYRSIILEGAWPSPAGAAAALLFSAASIALGALMFQRLAPGFADHL